MAKRGTSTGKAALEAAVAAIVLSIIFFIIYVAFLRSYGKDDAVIILGTVDTIITFALTFIGLKWG